MENIKRTLLVVEDDPGLQKQYKWSFERYDVHIAADAKQAIDILKKENPEVVTLDLGLPPDPTNVSVGFKVLQSIIDISPLTKIIIVTGDNDRANAVRAVSLGAYDFYQKPIEIVELQMIIDRAYNLHDLEQENLKLTKRLSYEPLSGVIACSDAMQNVIRTVEKVSPTDISILLLGESGTGKEVLARAIHRLSSRKGRFVAVNCAAIPETLLESELFGHEKGAFTGATKQTIGKIEYADGGTFFLDEIGDIPASLQVKLLRFIQERTIERLGGRREIDIDVRLLCATHCNLSDLIEKGEFRSDLYYRISEMIVEIPPLRERSGDSVVISRFLIDKLSKSNGKNTILSSGAINAIENYEWPGNIRELENKIKRALIMMENNHITESDLQLEIVDINEFSFDLKKSREKIEREVINKAIGFTDNNISKSAELLGITRPTLYSLMHKYGIMDARGNGNE